jgi:hypothetical protein
MSETTPPTPPTPPNIPYGRDWIINMTDQVEKAKREAAGETDTTEETNTP